MSEDCIKYIKEEYPKNRLTNQTLAMRIREKFKIELPYGDLPLTIKKLGLVLRTQTESMHSSLREKEIWK